MMNEIDFEIIRKRLATIADDLGVVPGLHRHIFLCSDQTEPKCCAKEDGLTSWNYLKKRLKELQLDGAGGVYRSKVNCLRICEHGPIMVIYPEGAWYHSCAPEVIERILQEHIQRGSMVKDYLFRLCPLAVT